MRKSKYEMRLKQKAETEQGQTEREGVFVYFNYSICSNESI